MAAPQPQAEQARATQASNVWAAPTATGPVTATVSVPGSKSLTNRYLLLAALAQGRSTISGGLRSRDSELMISALRALGAGFHSSGDAWMVDPIPAEPLLQPATLDCGLAGTVMRFVPPAAALCSGAVTFDGDPQARQRPMGTVLTALRDLGVDILSGDGAPDALPFTVRGTGRISGGELSIDASGSSQFVSALLLCAARMERGLNLRHTGESVPSPEHIGMTVAVLRAAGVEVDDSQPFRWRVAPGPIQPQNVQVEPDLSNAGPFLAAALVAGGSVSIPRWPANTTQIGAAWPRIIEQLGGTAKVHDGVLTASGNGKITGGHFTNTGELAPTVAALCALADAPSTLTGIAHLRGHETDRLAALRQEITNLGGQVEELPDGLRIIPKLLHGGVFATYHDHRMATAGAILGLAVPGVEVENIATTGKTLPDFPGMWADMLSGSAR